MPESNSDYDLAKIWVFVSAIIAVLTLIVSLVLKYFPKKTPSSQPPKKMNFVLIAFTIPLVIMLFVTTSNTSEVESDIKSFYHTFDQSFWNSTFFYLGMKDFSNYLKLLNSKLVDLQDLTVEKVYLDAKIDSRDVFSSIRSNLKAIELSSTYSQISDEISYDLEEASSALEVLGSLSDEFIKVTEKKVDDRKLKIEATIENASYIFGTYRDVTQLISKKVGMAQVLYIILAAICVIFSALLLFYHFRKTPEGQAPKNPEKCIAFVALFLALVVMIIGLSSSVVFFSVQRGVEKTHPGPLKVSYSENDPQVKGSTLALASLEAIEAKGFFAKIEENFRVLKKANSDVSKVGEADEILEKISETRELIRDYCLLVKKMALNLGDIDLLVKQINNRIAISNFNYPIAKHIEALGQRLGVVLKKNANTLLLLASMLFVAALGDICRIIIVS